MTSITSAGSSRESRRDLFRVDCGEAFATSMSAGCAEGYFIEDGVESEVAVVVVDDSVVLLDAYALSSSTWLLRVAVC